MKSTCMYDLILMNLIYILRDLSDRVNRFNTEFTALLESLWAYIEGLHLISLLDKVTTHGDSHVTKTNEADTLRKIIFTNL